MRYESIIVDTLFERFRRPFFEFWGLLFTHFRGGSAIARSELSLSVEKKKQPFADKIAVVGDQYAVAFTKDNTSYAGATVFGSRTEAEQHLSNVLAQNPMLAEHIHVVPAPELAA